jgi:flagellar motor protein MotB
MRPMRNDLNHSPMRRGRCAAFFCAAIPLALPLMLSGCSSASLFSQSKAPNREEQLVKTLNEERKRAQYYQAQYEQVIAKNDLSDRKISAIGSAGESLAPKRSGSGFSVPKLNERFVGTEAKSPKALARLANSLPGLRMGPDRTWAKLDADLLFAGGSQELSAGASDLLTDLAKTLKQESARDVRVLVVGYSDTQRKGEGEGAGGEDATWQIAAQRAVEVVRKLGQGGVEPDRLSAMSRGAQDPVAGNDTPAARAQNRRVEIYLLERDSTWAPDWTAALR